MACHDGEVTSRTSARVRIADLGGTEQSAVRRLLDLFRDHGWSDPSNAALVAVRYLSASQAGVSPKGLAASLPDTFYLRNAVTRTEVSDALGDLVAAHQGSSCR